VDCDTDTILVKIHQHGGAACHEGYHSCFFRRQVNGEWQITGEKVFDPAQVYGKGE
jgi:phosphoribosyl-AMP cyclohydrolase